MYYQEKTVKPAFSFWRSLMNCEKIDDIYVNIPETLMFYENSYCLLMTDDSGKLIRLPETNPELWKKTVLARHMELVKRFSDKMEY